MESSLYARTLLRTLCVSFYISLVTVLPNGYDDLHFTKDETNALNLVLLFRTQKSTRENVHCNKMAQISKNGDLLKWYSHLMTS